MLQAIRSNRSRRRVSKSHSLPAPVGGWDAINSIADMPENRAVVLDNWFPRPDKVVVRRGYKTHATGLGSSVVQTLMPYQGLSNSASRLFAVGNGTIYDVTAEATASATSVTGLSSNKFQYVNYANSSGNQYLWACDGHTPKMYDGSNWSSPTITGISASDIVNVAVHQNRLWFCLNDSMKAAYLNTDSIQGTATPFNLGSVMKKGGFLVSISTWTHDSGQGPDDYAVFLSSRGQAAVYQGTDPSSATTWSLVGVYDFGEPLGNRCMTKVAGDLAVITIDGVLPFSVARGVDRGADATVAITANINTVMNNSARSYKANFGWELTPYPRGMMALLNVPLSEGSVQHQYVMNTLTGSWCRFTGWNFNTFAVYNDNLYAGGNDGKVYQCDFGAIDGSTAISAVGQGAYNYLKSRGQLKRLTQMRALISTDTSTRPTLGISTDFKDNASISTPSPAATSSALYDTAIYDTDVYAIEGSTVADWTAVSGIGQCASVHFRASTSNTNEVNVGLNGFDVIYEPGEFY